MTKIGFDGKLDVMPDRRTVLSSLLALTGLGALGVYFRWFKEDNFSSPVDLSTSGGSMIRNQFSLDFQWPVQQPFLFCVHHLDLYPKAESGYGPGKNHLQGRDLGQDFNAKDGFRMYHGEEVPGFPVHPHRGFETITVVRKGYVDHADSLGAAGRYGEGDVQWMTAGAGVQHSEMFPLLKKDDNNTLELFQIWLNLPKRSKMSPAYFKMFWSENIPQQNSEDQKVKVNLIAGEFNQQKALTPPPDSWAADANNDVMILLVKISEGGVFKLPRSKNLANRTLYFFDGDKLNLNGTEIRSRTGVEVDSSQDLEIKNASGPAELLVLQARPIGEPVFQHGPFVMNTREDIVKTLEDYQKTQFGGWKWPRHDMVHGPVIERFAKYPDGRIEKPDKV